MSAGATLPVRTTSGASGMSPCDSWSDFWTKGGLYGTVPVASRLDAAVGPHSFAKVLLLG